jgi:hypothetical protein
VPGYAVLLLPAGDLALHLFDLWGKNEPILVEGQYDQVPIPILFSMDREASDPVT